MALHAITDNPASDYSINPTNIASAWNSGDLIVLGTSNSTPPPSSYIVGGTPDTAHAYAVVGYNASSSKPFEVFNPWGTDSSGWAPGHSGTIYGLFTANATFISQNFVGQSVGTGAINVNNGLCSGLCRVRALQGQTEFQVNLKLGLTSREESSGKMYR